MHHYLFGTIACCLSLLITENAVAQSKRAPSIGDTPPAWKNLAGTDGKQHSLADLDQFDVLVVVFTCNSCPYSVDYEDRIIALQKKLDGDGSRVRVIAINSNKVAADSMDEMKKRAKDKAFNFPYLWDESQEVAKGYGAIYTPEFFVLNKERRIVYKGAMDDSTKAENVKVNFVEIAVKAALAGKTPKVTKTGARGCAIRFKRTRR